MQELCGSAQGTSLSILYIWGFELVSIYSHYIYCVHSALSELGSSGLQNSEVLSSPAVLPKSESSGFANPEVLGSADSEFNPLHLSENL